MNIKLPERVDISPLLASKPCSPVAPPSSFSSRSIQPQILTQPQQYLPTQLIHPLAPMNHTHIYQPPQRYNIQPQPQQNPHYSINPIQPHYQPQPQFQPSSRISPFQPHPLPLLRPQPNIVTMQPSRNQSPPSLSPPSFRPLNLPAPVKTTVARPLSPKIQFKYVSPAKQSRNLSEIREVSHSSGFHYHSISQQNQDKVTEQKKITTNTNNIKNNKNHSIPQSQLSPMQKIKQLISSNTQNKNKKDDNLINQQVTNSKKSSQSESQKSQQSQKWEKNVGNNQRKNQNSITNYIYMVQDQRKQQERDENQRNRNQRNGKNSENHHGGEEVHERDYESIGNSKDYQNGSIKQLHGNQKNYSNQTFGATKKQQNNRNQNNQRKQSTDGQAVSLMPIIQQQQQRQNTTKQQNKLQKQKQSPKIPQFSISSTEKPKIEQTQGQLPLVSISRPSQSPSFSSTSQSPEILTQTMKKQQSYKIQEMQKQYEKLKYQNANYLDVNMNSRLPRVQRNSSDQNSAQDSILSHHRKNDLLDTNQNPYTSSLRYKSQNWQQYPTFQKKPIKQSNQYMIPDAPQSIPSSKQASKKHPFYQYKFENYNEESEHQNKEKDVQLELKVKEKDLEIKNLKNQVWLMKLRENQLLETIKKLQKLNKDQFLLIQHLGGGNR